MSAIPIGITKLKIHDLGYGKKKRPGAIGVHYSDRHKADVMHDLTVLPYPFESDSKDQVNLDNVRTFI